METGFVSSDPGRDAEIDEQIAALEAEKEAFKSYAAKAKRDVLIKALQDSRPARLRVDRVLIAHFCQKLREADTLVQDKAQFLDQVGRNGPSYAIEGYAKAIVQSEEKARQLTKLLRRVGDCETLEEFYQQVSGFQVDLTEIVVDGARWGSSSTCPWHNEVQRAKLTAWAGLLRSRSRLSWVLAKTKRALECETALA